MRVDVTIEGLPELKKSLDNLHAVLTRVVGIVDDALASAGEQTPDPTPAAKTAAGKEPWASPGKGRYSRTCNTCSMTVYVGGRMKTCPACKEGRLDYA